MKATAEVTAREALLERIRELAEQALGAWLLERPRLTLLEHKKNVTFRVEEAGGRRHVLRVCDPDGFRADEIRSELQYLLALGPATGLVVPEPVPARDGSLLVPGDAEGLERPRWCALFRWVPGRMVADAPTPRRIEQVGEIAGRLHRFAEEWQPPAGFTRPRWDAAGLFGSGPVLAPGVFASGVFSSGQGAPLIGEGSRELLDEAAAVVRATMAGLGEGREVFGLIHKDLEPDNTVVEQTEGGERVHPIDFADCGWGYYLYDVAASLLPLYEKAGFAAMREAFLRGYRRIRPLRPEHIELLETFFIARGIFSVRLMTGRLADLPHVREYAQSAVPQILGGIRGFLERRRGGEGIPRTTVQVLTLLRGRGVKLWAEGEKLRYSAPPGALTAELIAELKQRKAELLGFLRQGETARRSGAPARIEAAHRERPPLSFAQQRLWLLHQLFPQGVEYNIGRAVRLRGRVRVELLAAALQEIVRRHASLRTTFEVDDGQPVQVAAPELALPLPLVDCTALPAERREAEAWRLAQDDAARPFDLARGPLLRVFLIRLDAGDHVAPSTMHHVIGDGWSTGILFREMGLVYAALMRGRPPALPTLPVQYVDYAVWQRQWLTGPVLDEQLAYWKEQLAGAPHELDLPTDRPRSAARGDRRGRGDRRPLLIPPPLTETLRELGQEQGATLFMVLLAAWQTLLCRISGQDDVVVGSPIANRNRTEIEGLIGCFVNTLVLRTVFSGEPTFREALAAVRQTTLGAYAHQDLPFEKIVEELRPERSLAQTPLFQVIFTLQNVPSPDMEAAGFRMTLMPPTRRAAMVDLTCNMKEMPEGVQTSFMYKEDLFDGATIERLAGHYLRLLEAAAADPGRSLRELPLLAPAEAQQLLEWGGIREEHAAEDTLSTLFEAQARQAPEAPAVSCEGVDLTYAELNRRATRLAHHLRRLGVGPEARVGLYVERSLDLIVGMLGILKAGGAYLPLDPGYPRERLAFLVEDAGARVVVSSKDLKDSKDFKDTGDASLQSLESLPSLAADAHNTAYVIYTSGSTGKPKGVSVTHANVVRLFRATQSWFGFGPGDVWTLFHSPAFDFSVWEIWGALLHGGRLVIVPWEVTRTPEAFYRLLAGERVTVLNQTPTAFAELQNVVSGDLPDLRLVIFGGEALLPARLAPWLARHGDARPRLVNMYGITETTVHVTYRPLTAKDSRSVIGIPILDLAVHVLDVLSRGGQLAPIGAPGELAVGGAGLARGYLGRPELTAERFVPDPFSGRPGARLYRSGDLGRFLSTGELEYLGRIDHQVKIRGFRIEPGETEAALLAHPDVREAVVLAHDGRLIACVVSRPERRPKIADLRSLLSGTLPEHQVPLRFVLLDALPLTVNGKVDRKALLVLDEATGQEEGGFVAPRTPAEELLAGIFAEVLQVEEVGARGHFFELGGHSLLATQVLSRMRQALGVELPLRVLFEEPTVAGLARAVETSRGAAPPPPPHQIIPVPRDRPLPLPLSFAQQRLWLIDQLEPDNPVFNVFSAVRLRGPARRDLLLARLEDVVRRHEPLRTTFLQHDGEPFQAVHTWLPPDVADIDLTALVPGVRERELRRLAQGELLRPFDLARGPLVRARFVALAPDESAALLAMHHIVSDEWSMRLLVEEICAAPAALTELPVQYADYAAWQRAWLHGETLAAELAWWREHLADAPELLALPTDRPRPAVQTFRGTSSGQTLPAELAAALRSVSRGRSATLFMLHLTAFQALLARLTGESEIVVGTPIAGRNRLETERLIGFFVNTLALRATVEGRASLGELLARTRETVLSAHAHQDLPFELLVEAVNPRRSLSHTPLFQVMLNLATGASRLELPGLAIAPLDGLRSGIAPFDLTLSVVDTGERTRLVFEYSTDLFDATTIERLHGYLRETLQVLAAAPETGLHEVALWSPAESHQVLTEWNDTAVEAVSGPSLHGLFETWVRETPEAPAVFFENGFDGGSWSFAELDGRAEGLARRLRRLGVGTETVVGLSMAGGPELALGMLGVLKAGGAFLPLDPRWPAARREMLLEDAGALLVLEREGVWGESGPAVSRPPVSPRQTAYVIYTSGSTGRPKGVAVGHGAAVWFAGEMAERFNLGEGERFLQFASPGFDVLIEEVFPVWARGGAVVFAPQEELLSPAGLERTLERHRVTGLELPAPYWNEWADDLERRGGTPPRSLRRLLLGSEKPSVERLARWSRYGVPVIHVFGLTETTVTSTLHRWTGHEPPGRELPIGRPVGDTRLYVLDREGTPVPPGVVGELYIGGAGVARGYLRHPDLTAERFVPDAFADRTDRTDRSDRLYRTGDLARYRPDGRLDFLGRLDEQVKVRGVRVEPGEVAAVLERHPGVSEAFVALRDARLVAWVVPAAGVSLDREELRSHLAGRLPEPMVPSAIVELPALPRTPNGKIDRAALPVPDRGMRAEKGEAPRTPAEELLAGIWCEVLGRERVGREEDFFALGGHSLLATRVVSRVRQAFGIELPLRALFEAPTVAGLARTVEAGRGTAPPAIVPVPRNAPLPLSFAQQRLWLIDQLEPGSAAYNIPAGMRLGGALEPALLELVFAEVVRRHEVLRTTFASREGRLVQLIAPPDSAAARPELPLIDLTDLSDRSDPSDQARGIALAEAQRPFDLERGPLLRLLLVRLDARDHLLLVTMHHIVSDGWSVDVLIREVAALHAAFSRGRSAALPELPVQYADFAVWQREWLQGEVLEAQLAAWGLRLAGAPQVLDLPTDRPRPALPTFRGAARPVALPAGLSAAVREAGRRLGATPFMTLLAAWTAVLGRHAGQDDLLVGAPVAGRNRRETEGLIGFFVNTLVLRADLSGAPTFAEALQRVREEALEAFTHQDLPFERLVEEVVAQRDLSRAPLIQVLFALQSGFAPDLEIPGLTLTPIEGEIRNARFELILNLEDEPEGISGVLEHSTDLFDTTTVERLAHRFQTLLAAAVAEPATAISELPLLSTAETRQLLEWGGIREEHAAGETLVTLFEAQVRKAPGACAVTCEGIDLTYAELDRRSSQLAHHLRRLGVGPEVRVGLCVGRSLDLITGMLGIVKAGGAYVPLDPSYPPERLAYLVEDAGARVVVSSKDFKDDNDNKDVKDTGDSSLESLEPLPSLAADADNTAYVIYTSGSTGLPKGVEVTHANVVRLFHATEPWFGFGPGDVWTLFHSAAFDFSVWEIWGALLYGGRLVVVPWEVTRTPEAFHGLLARERVTVLNQTPTAFAELQKVDSGALPDLRLVIFGGEALQPARLVGWFDRHGDAQPRLVNMYGITETTVHVTCRPLSAADTRSVIGIPIPDLAVHVLDRNGLLAPIGVPGEIAVGGAGLARGYLGRPALTAERFVPDPFSGRPGARLYRSGDLGRFLPGGELEYLGRIDHQVKIRGFRIEPGEIEAALLAHPGVQEAVVLAREGRLVAFLVPERRPAWPRILSELRSFLLDTLPEHQVPSAFVLLDALPRTANGKVDRKALLALGEAPRPEGGFVAPRTPAEELVAGIFADVLKLGAVGADAHFFELGGHSLLATRVISRVRQALGVELPLRTLFEKPTVAALASVLAEELQGQVPVAPPLVRVPRGGLLPLSFAQQRLWFIDQLEPDNPVYNVFGAVRLRGAARRDLLQMHLEARLEQIVRRHETLRTTFAQHDGEPVQIIHPWLPPDVATLDLTALAPGVQDRELRRLAEGEIRRPFDLARGPLLRVRWIALGPEESAALLTLHHIVSDEWSMGVLVEELRGAAAALPELPVQYADYAVWQRGWLLGEVLEAELAYWRRHLDGAPELLALPTDRPRPAVQTFQGTSREQVLPADLVSALHAAGKARSATLFMLHLTAVQVLLARWTGESEIVVGTPIAGRNRLETEGLIGFFVNTLALRASLAGRISLGDLLARTRETVLAAHTHQDLPFELLVEEINPRRSLSHTPLFQVMMNLETAARRLELSELSVAPLDGLRGGIAPFDLTLSISGPRIEIEYSTDLFDATTVERLHGSLRQVLQALAIAPGMDLHDVPLWSPAERHQVLAEWNDTEVAPPSGDLHGDLHGLFEAWVRRAPDAPAAFFTGGSWSFAELDGRAERLACRLRGLGVGAEQVVGVLAAGGPELALGMLGVLKAGGAFLPLDPRWPEARRAELLQDAGARVLVDGETAHLRGPALPPAPVSPEQTAYVIYTSGSTGRPKGVMVSHGTAVSFAIEMARQLGLGAGDRFLQLASPGFDVLIEEVFPVWARGGAVVFAPQEELLTRAGLERVLERHGVTCLELPTPYWNEWADDLDRRGEAPPRPVRLLLLGSEKPSVERLARWSRHGIGVVHVFGLTETTVTSTTHRWNGSQPASRELPIGRPVGNARLYVLDREGAPVPSGVVGELHIGGAGVARGYLGRPELTAERFVPDPFADPTDRSDRSDRLYRTGDLARYRSDGTLDFLGRIDEQVKVRGVRIEPGEVAAVLERHPAVAEAFAGVREARLIAWVVPAPGGSPGREALRSHLAARLPEAMVPSELVELPALPRTANGKIDRAALPVPDRGTGEAGEAPRTPVEELLAGIWSEVLGRSSVGRDEDFFALGGHSLLATRVISRVRGVLGVDLPLRSLFEAPTVAGLALAVEAGRGVAPPPPIVPVPRDRDLPLSFAQHRLWLIDRLAPGSAVYNVPAAMRLLGVVEPAFLERIFAEIVRRHEVLRTTFVPRGGGAVQIVAPPATPALPVIDLAGLPDRTDRSDPSDRSDLLAREIARDEAARPFDLEHGPLLRLLLIRLGARDHLLLMTMHHIVSDGWSTDVLVREVAALHAAFSRGQASPLPELPVQYADFAVWQREWLQGEVLEAQLAVWRRRLAGAPQVLDLPTDRSRPPVQTFRGAERPVALPAGLAAAVREVSRRHGVTPFMTLLASWAAVLGRHAGQDDLLIGAPVAGRNRQEVEGLIGFFVNTLVLRADLSGAPTFVEALRRVREAALEAFTHQDLPFERLVEAVVAQRDVARSPLIQVLFALQSGFEERLEIPELTLAPVEDEVHHARFELILNLEERTDGILGALEHNTDLFDDATVERLAGHFETLLAAAMAAPEREVTELPLLSTAERQTLLEWGGAREEPVAGTTLAELFEARVRQAPEARAVTWEGRELTYAELDARAERLARRLQRLGVGPEVRVGLRVERSRDLITGMLGILKAGGAYVPLDPSYPPERLAYLVEDSGARVVVTPEDFKDDKDCKDTGDSSLESLPSLPSLRAGAHNTAYVIYTSGSTGRPKGVVVTHANVVRLFQATEPWFGFGPSDAWTLFHSYAFDFSVWEIWGALLYGGRLVVVPWEVSRTPEAFHDLLARERVTVLNQTPSAFAELQRVDEDPARAGALADLRLVIFGGEALAPSRLAPWLARHGDERPRLVNMYGITETTVHVTYRPLSAAEARSVIGVPIPDLAAHVLDVFSQGGRLAPIGVPGELAVGGAGVARGYLGRPDLTAERFVPDPFSGRPGARLYRSGDLGRFLPTGELEYLGRIDYQVKIRGFRIEPGEIEAALLAHPAVRRAVVLARDGRLVAFVVGNSTSDLRAFLLGTLPEHQVPAAFVPLEALPLTAHGKVDRKALLALDATSSFITEADGFVPPRTPAEELLTDIWIQVLGRSRVGGRDHFFELGGDSLLALQVVGRCGRAGLAVTPQLLFTHPVLADLAAAATADLAVATGAPPPVGRAPRERPLPLSFAQERLWFIDRLEPDRAAYNIPLAIAVRGALSVPACAAALSSVVRRHEALRTTFVELDGRPVQVIAPPAAAPAPLPLVDLSVLPARRSEPETLFLASVAAALPFDLARGPLLRALVVRRTPAEHALLLVLHHIVADGWSLAILMREISTLLGDGAAPPELPLHYADYTAWQRQWLTDDRIERELAYWRGLLAGVPLRIELPTDRPRLATDVSGAAGNQILGLPAAAVERIGELARSLGVTPFMVYLAAYQILLSRLTGQERLVVGIAVANRLQPETEEIVGHFVNTLPLPADLRDDPPLPDLLAQVREVTLGAFAHQQVPFERLVEDLQPERSLEQTPVVQVMLVLQNATRPAFAAGGIERIEVPGLSFEPLPLPAGAAKLDLILELVEAPQGLAASWEHRTVFEASTVARWAQGWAHLLAALAEQLPAAPRASELELLSAAERHQLLVEWSGAASDYPRDLSVHELFAARAAAHPEAVAMVALPSATAEPVTLTYGELAARAGCLAARLLSLGAAPDAPVGVCFERSPELIVALLGVLGAGGAFAPLDPQQPPERMAAMLDDLWPAAASGSPRLLLTSVRHAVLFERFAAGGGRVVLAEEGDTDGLDAGPWVSVSVRERPCACFGDRLAYVMFTSGSTGRPKGVAVTHRGVVRLVCGADYADFGPGETWLQIAPASFDASTLEIWGALLHGGRLVLMPPGTPTLAELATILLHHRVTTLHLTAGLFHQMVEEDLRALTTVPQLLTGGEALSPAHMLRAVRELPATRLTAAYGPTEGTTFSTCWQVRAKGIEGSVPIGRPIPNTLVLVLDIAGRPAGIGVAGELVIAGDGLARGYLGRPDLTAERFRPHPLASHPGERVYHTGDLARFLPDGTLAFLGRVDRQVKIRGFRVEPAEVEAALRTLPGVAEAVVMAHRESGELRLLGFVTGEGLEPAALRRELRGRLPEAFVPSALWVIPALPLTANGKVDREALLRLGPLAPRGAADAGEPVAAAPRDPLEELVAGIWSAVLEVERVGPDDSFFDLGGHSLRATQVMSRLRQASGVDLPLRLLFEAPTVAGLTARLRAALVSGGDAGLLEAWTAIPRREPGAELPLSFAQERLWFLDQLVPGDTVYNIPGALLLSGRLDVAALAAAIAEVVRRHEGLRTIFLAQEGRPLQVVLPPAPRPLPVIDLAALPEAARAATATRLQREEARRSFDLAGGPLLRTVLVRLEAGAAEAPQRHLLLLTLHHIVFDGWSVGVLAGELAALYAAALERRPSPLPELPIQYGDFAVWQRVWLSGDNLARIVGYWRQRLTGVTPLRLPFDRPRPPLQTFSGDYVSVGLSPALAGAVRGLARRQAVTPFMVGLTAFVALLHRASGQSDFAVGTWVANRNRAELEGLIGFFINNLALRLDLSGAPTFSRLLDQVREVALGAYAHQDLPFEKLLEDLKLPRDLSMPPVFQVVCVQQPPSGRMELPAVSLEPLSSAANPANVDLLLDLSDPAGGPYTATLVYNCDLFDRATITRFGAHFERLLAAALEPGEAAVDTLPLLSPAEAWQVAGEWSRGLPRPAGERLPGIDFVHQLIERHAALRPAAEAVVWPGDGASDAVRLTYGELNARANRLARILRHHDVGPEVRVALWLPRSADLVVSALAVLKAGCCYVPLDATYSGERLAFMAADARARVLLTHGSIGDIAPPPGATILRLDDSELAAALAAESGADLDPAEAGLDPADLAYVIYTSGSTGRPKGTMIEHRGLLTAYYAYEQAYRLGEVGTHLQMASFSFDVFTGDLVRALGSGARLVLCPREVLLDPARLHTLMVAERVDGAEFVPAVVRALVEHLERADGSLDFMRLVVVSSDAWYAGEVAPLARLCGPRTRLIDSYGVTEATIDTTFLPLAAGDGTPCLPVPTAAAVVPIGRPLAGNEAWVLGRELDLLPARLPGELCIGGAGVARGYLGRPELTAEKFTPHPFSTVPGARLYRAGDLARWLPDGSVEFLGRVDNQIKVRGFRIEPGEIEAALGAHPQVRQAVVLALDGGGSPSTEPGRKHLVAYVVPHPEAIPDEADVRAFLKQRLPDYMVPALFVPLAELPLTPNGKVDRRALPLPDWSRSVERAVHQPPRTAAEEMLAAIWCEVLRVSSVGAFDDFFAIGGHSLLATQVVARVRAAVGVELPLRALFETPSLAELAQVVEEQLILQMDDLTDEEVADLS